MASAFAKAIHFAGFSLLKSAGPFTRSSVTRSELEHVIRAAGAITNEREWVIVGSQAILGSFPNAPEELRVSQEVDTFPLGDSGKSDLVDRSIGEKSPFHETFGYYAHGVSPETAILPLNWKSRLVRIDTENTNGIAGLCISPLDLVVSKLAAGREKDLSFVTAMFRHKLITPDVVEQVRPELSSSTADLILARARACWRAAQER